MSRHDSLSKSIPSALFASASLVWTWRARKLRRNIAHMKVHKAMAVGVVFLACFQTAQAADLIMDGGTITLGGVQTYGTVSLTNGAKIVVPPYDGSDRINTGNLEIHADSITIDASSQITAKGAGYTAVLCRNGTGPNASAGGRGGCAVRDSAGGGAHFGDGGRGTKNYTGLPFTFPRDFEEAGGDEVVGSACLSAIDIRNNDGLPTVAGLAFTHAITTIDFGAAGGDKGCRDGDGFADRAAGLGGNGGGRIALFTNSGTLNIDGRIDATGNRGCALGNDTAGGGAGGSVLLSTDQLLMGANAVVTAAGGQGGDTLPKCLSCSSSADCGNGQTCNSGRCSPCNCTPCSIDAQCNASLGQTCKNLGGDLGKVCADASNQCTPVDALFNEAECNGTQYTGISDKSGGGGGGGFIHVISQSAAISAQSMFRVNGGPGGRCAGCPGLSNQTDGQAGKLELTTVTVSAIDNLGAEVGADPITFRFSRSPVTASDLAVSYTVAGTATNGTDYSPALSGAATIAANASYVDVTLTPANDSDIEGDETVELTLVETADYHLLGSATVTATITDKPVPNIVLGVSSSSVNPGDSVTLTATLSGGSSPTGTVDFRDNGASIAACAARTISAGSATCVTTALASGAHTNLTAIYSGDSANNSATSAATSLTVRSNQSITFNALANRQYGSGAQALSATATSGLPVSFSSASPSRCSVTGNSATLLSVGTCVITADQAGDATWLPATQVSRSFHITAPASTGLPPRSGPAATGAGTINVTGSAPGTPPAWSKFQFIRLSGDADSPPANSAPVGLVFPFGLFEFTVSGMTPGGTLVLDVRYPAALPTESVYWKYGPTPDNATAHWYQLPVAISADRMTATLTIIDGELGDDDLLPNGVVVDQGGPAAPAGDTAASIPTVSSGVLYLLSLLVMATGWAAAMLKRRV